MMCPQHRCAITRRLITWRVTELYGARWRRRRRRCREDGSSGASSGLSVGRPDFLTLMPIRLNVTSSFNSFARVR